MFADPRGPIEHFSWARFVVCGQEHSASDAGAVGAGKDICLIGYQVSPWHERRGHCLTPAMVSRVYGQGIEVLVIGSGVSGLLQCPADVQHAIRAQGIAELVIERTPDACRAYNALYRQGRRVALLAHGTC